MENPLELPAPPEDDRLARIYALARDIAYGALHGKWTPHLRVKKANDQAPFEDSGLKDCLTPKWGNYHNYYAVHLLVSFGYLVKSQVDLQEAGITFYDVTPKAFALLEKPATPPSVFISYKRDYSSALALLIEAKLKLRDSGMEIFIDKVIKPGDDWEEQIKEKINNCPNFICLLAPNTFSESKWVRKELTWANKAGSKIITVFHGGCRLDNTYPKWIGKKQIINVDLETAKHYESALDEILVGLGYSTY
jgi:TIR domain